MRTASQLVLTFFLNACWQIALITLVATVSARLLRDSQVRFRHTIWLTALFLSFIVPLLGSFYVTLTKLEAPEIGHLGGAPTIEPPFTQVSTPPSGILVVPQSFTLARSLGIVLLALYFAFVVFRLIKLLQAWRNTQHLRLSATQLENNKAVSAVIGRCESALSMSIRPGAVKVLSSSSVPVPITVGLHQPVIILPEKLVDKGSPDLLLTAIGHEFIHIARSDYLLNLLCELVYVPIAFHPATALLRRRVKQTRELCCDELVTKQIVNAEIYARSLVTLASSAPNLRRLSVTTTVGIADADILEARIMSLLKRPKADNPWKRVLATGFSLLLLVPCLVAAAFAMKFDLEVPASAQEPSQQEKERREKEATETRARVSGDQEVRWKTESDPRFREEIMRKREMEIEMRAIRQAALVRLARINMDQAIQIASSQYPGKVLQCTLDGEKWEEPGKLAKDGLVFYRVVIVGDDPDAGATHVWINAVDGSLIKTEKELMRKRHSPDNQ